MLISMIEYIHKEKERFKKMNTVTVSKIRIDSKRGVVFTCNAKTKTGKDCTKPVYWNQRQCHLHKVA